MNLAVILLAAGRSLRYGGDKLEAVVEGRTLLERALDIVQGLKATQRVAVVSTAQRAETARRLGVQPVMNPRPDAGIARSVQLGLDACAGADAYLFMVCDQPYLQQRSVERLVGAYAAGECSIACLGRGNEPGNPVIFDARYLPELYALTGDAGGKRVVRAHPQALCIVQAQARELWDLDVPTQEGRPSCKG